MGHERQQPDIRRRQLRTATMSNRRYWLRQLDRPERSALIATFSGWMLDGLDVMVYTFVLPMLIVLWHISRTQAGVLATSTLLTSSVGGWLAGLAADRYGRVRVLQVTIIWFAVFTFVSGLTHSFAELLVARGLQGLGFGGEWAVGSVLIGEQIRPAFRGRAVGTTQAGWSIGWALAAGLYVLTFRLFNNSAWRVMFFIGILPALFTIWIRSHVREPEIFRQARRPALNLSFLHIFSPHLMRTTLLASLVALGAQGGYYAVNTFLPFYLRSRGFDVTRTGGYIAIVIAGSFAGYLLSAHLADRLGRKTTLIAFAAGAFVAIAAYTVLPLGDSATLALGFPVGFFSSGAFGPMGSFFTELFPTSIRGSAQGFTYNCGRGVGAIFPTLVGAFSTRIGLAGAIAVFSASAYLLMALSVLFLPETRDRKLEELDDQKLIVS